MQNSAGGYNNVRTKRRTFPSFGGDFSTNLVSGGIGYQMLFFPFLPNAPFQRAFDVHMSFQFPHSASATVATTLLPTGKMRYTIFGNQYLYGPLAMTSTPQQHYATGGKYLIRGRVIDQTGAPVDGAAVQIGQQIVFSDQQGTFFARFNSGKVQPVRVLPDQFAAPGNWSVVSAPTTAAPDTEPQPLVVVVARQ